MKLYMIVYLFCIIVLMPSAPLSAQTREFQQRFELAVPARGPFGAPPKRQLAVEFNLPSGSRCSASVESTGQQLPTRISAA